MATMFVWAIWSIMLRENFVRMSNPFPMAERVIPPFIITALYTNIPSSATGKQ
jgi:hypothetical protein